MDINYEIIFVKNTSKKNGTQTWYNDNNWPWPEGWYMYQEGYFVGYGPYATKYLAEESLAAYSETL
jgi:hypothetical protein